MNESYNTSASLLFVFNYRLCTSDHALRGSKLIVYRCCFSCSTYSQGRHRSSSWVRVSTRFRAEQSATCLCRVLVIEQCCRRRAVLPHTYQCRSDEYRYLWFVRLKFVIIVGEPLFRSRNRSTVEIIARRWIFPTSISVRSTSERGVVHDDALIESNNPQ